MTTRLQDVERQLGAAMGELVRAAVADEMRRAATDLADSMRHIRPLAVNQAEAGKLLGVSAATVARMLAAGVLPRLPHTGSKVQIPLAAIEDFCTAAARPRQIRAAS